MYKNAVSDFSKQKIKYKKEYDHNINLINIKYIVPENIYKKYRIFKTIQNNVKKQMLFFIKTLIK